MKTETAKCPECGAESLYKTTTNAIGHEGPRLLPGLGSFFKFPKIEIVVCGDCGLTRFYADAEARAKLPKASQWQRI